MAVALGVSGPLRLLRTVVALCELGTKPPPPVECGTMPVSPTPLRQLQQRLRPWHPREQRILFTRADITPERTLLQRAVIVVFLVMLVLGVLWWDRAGFKDNVDGEITFADIVYFTSITITTVGYGDIVPVSQRARLIDALFITPIRLFIWFIFLGTAYQFVVAKMLEGYRMAKLQRRLSGHIIVCGYGHTGRSAALELAAKGCPADNIIALDDSEQAVQSAVEDGFVALRGDAAREGMLQRAGIERAQAVIVTPGRDDTTVLVVLTARQLNPKVRIIAAAMEAENIKLLKQGGADVIVSPSQVGGYLISDAIDRRFTVDYLYDLMTAGGDVMLIERPVNPHEIGATSRAVEDGLIAGILRANQRIDFWSVEQTPRRDGDILLIIGRANATRKAAH